MDVIIECDYNWDSVSNDVRAQAVEGEKITRKRVKEEPRIQNHQRKRKKTEVQQLAIDTFNQETHNETADSLSKITNSTNVSESLEGIIANSPNIPKTSPFSTSTSYSSSTPMRKENDQTSVRKIIIEGKERKLPWILTDPDMFFDVRADPRRGQQAIIASCTICSGSNKDTLFDVRGDINSTGNFHKHQKKHHPSKYYGNPSLKNEVSNEITNQTLDKYIIHQTIKKKIPKVLMNSIQRITKTERLHLQRFRMEKTVRFFVYTLYPLNIIDRREFRDLFFLDTAIGYTLPTRKMVTERISAIRDLVFGLIIRELREVNYVAISADLWSKGEISFLGITAFWIVLEKNCYTRRSCTLACLPMVGSINNIQIKNVIIDILKKFDLETKVVACVTDEESNCTAAFNYFGETASTRSKEKKSPVLPLRFSCATRKVHNVALKDFYRDLQECYKETNIYMLHQTVLRKCNLLSLLSNNQIVNLLFKNQLINGKSKLKKPVETRWCSTYDIFSDMLKNVENLNRIIPRINNALKNNAFKCNYIKKEISLISEQQILYLQAYVEVFSCLANFISSFESDKVLIGSLMPGLLSIRNILKGIINNNPNQNNLKNILASILLENLENENRFQDFYRFSTENKSVQWCIVAAVCHPAFKMRWVRASDTDEIELSLPELKHKFQKITIKWYLEHIAKNRSLPNSQRTETEKPKTLKNNIFNACFSDDEDDEVQRVESQTRIRNTEESMIECEINRYLLEPKVDVTDFPSLNEHLSNFPCISLMFKKLNTVPCTSASVERLFSPATYLHHPKRNKLADENFEDLIFLRGNANYWYSNSRGKENILGGENENEVSDDFEEYDSNEEEKEPTL